MPKNTSQTSVNWSKNKNTIELYLIREQIVKKGNNKEIHLAAALY